MSPSPVASLSPRATAVDEWQRAATRQRGKNVELLVRLTTAAWCLRLLHRWRRAAVAMDAEEEVRLAAAAASRAEGRLSELRRGSERFGAARGAQLATLLRHRAVAGLRAVFGRWAVSTLAIAAEAQLEQVKSARDGMLCSASSVVHALSCVLYGAAVHT